MALVVSGFLPLLFASLSWALPASTDSNIGQIKGLGDGLNFQFAATDSSQPFTINVNTDFTSTNLLKSSMYRPSRPIAIPTWSDGPPTASLMDLQQYYLNSYSWSDTQTRLNKLYKNSQFTTTVSAGPNYTTPQSIHLAHLRSPRPDAIPLLMLHGFPSSYLEFSRVIHSLTSPPNASLPAFHIVTPNLPGFAFSPAPINDGFGAHETAIAFNNLMHQFNYTRYAVYSTDLGSIVARWLLHEGRESVISLLTSFYPVTPTEQDIAKYAAGNSTPEENEFFRRYNYFVANDSAYISIQTTKPLVLAEAMSDSFIGWMAWFWEYRYHGSGDFLYTFEELITQAIVLFFQGTYGMFSFYKRAFFQRDYPNSNIPVGIMHFQSGGLGRDDAYQYVVRDTHSPPLYSFCSLM
jgi:pimeloyl-ACP methyl ester carboxylesterase